MDKSFSYLTYICKTAILIFLSTFKTYLYKKKHNLLELSFNYYSYMLLLCVCASTRTNTDNKRQKHTDTLRCKMRTHKRSLHMSC